MKTCFIIKISEKIFGTANKPVTIKLIAIADLTDTCVLKEGKRVYEINRINVPERFRHRGYGNKLLAEVLAAADAAGAVLRLYPLPSGAMDKDALIAWYERHGFALEKCRSPCYWYRLPIAVDMQKQG